MPKLPRDKGKHRVRSDWATLEIVIHHKLIGALHENFLIYCSHITNSVRLKNITNSVNYAPNIMKTKMNGLSACLDLQRFYCS